MQNNDELYFLSLFLLSRKFKFNNFVNFDLQHCFIIIFFFNYTIFNLLRNPFSEIQDTYCIFPLVDQLIGPDKIFSGLKKQSPVELEIFKMLENYVCVI